MLINASLQKSEFYLDTVRGLCPNTTYEFAAWVMNVILPSACGGNTIPPNLTFSIETTSGTVLQTYNTGNMGAQSSPQWNQFGFFFTTPAAASNVVLRISNNSQGGCGNDLAIDDITFRPCGPKVTPKFGDGTPGILKDLCVGDNNNVVLNCDVSQGYTNPSYQWQLSTDNSASWADIPGADAKTLNRSFTSATPVGDYIFRLTVVESLNAILSSCRVASSTLTVRVNSLPVPSVSSNSPVCEGSAVVLNASGGAKYLWGGVNGFSASGSSVTVPNCSIDNAGKYFVTATSAAGCKGTDSTTVAINVRPKAVINTEGRTICSGDTVPLSSTGGTSYVWSPTANLSDPNISNPVASPEDTTVYKVTVTNNLFCTDTALVTINVIASPNADAGPDQFILEGQSVTLSASVSGNIDRFLWSPAVSISDVQSLQPIVSPAATTRYIFSITSSNGCGSAIDSVLVFVYKKVIVPNAFSPNGDGINDTWNITALNTYDDYDLLVFNRYGRIVFQSKNYSNDWNGTFDGKSLPVGTYYYFIDVKHNLPKLSGSVTILR